MNKTEIKIKRLGAIRDGHITLTPLMVFSGESGLGKSYLAFLIHYLYRVVLEDDRLDSLLRGLGWDVDVLSSSVSSSLLYLPIKKLEKWLSVDAVEYLKEIVGNNELNAEISIQLPKHKEDNLAFSFKKEAFVSSEREIVSMLFELDEHIIRVPAGTRQLGVYPWRKLLADFLKDLLFQDDALEQTFTMVPGRGALLNIDYKSQELVKSHSRMYSEFFNDWGVVKGYVPSEKEKVDPNLSLELQRINGGPIVQKDEAIFFKIESSTLLPISAAASSTKELTPLVMLYEKYPANKLSILFEEPEAHLHPSKQIAIADFVAKAVSSGTHMQVTTHSDYFIRRINDRIMLGQIRQKDTKRYNSLLKKLEHFDDSVLDSSIVSAYLLKRQDDDSVSIITQSVESGIPYDSFHDVLQNDFYASLEINKLFKEVMV